MARPRSVPCLVGMAAMLSRSALAQQRGTVTPEESPAFFLQQCTVAGGCVTQPASIVLDSNWRWVHNSDGYENCFSNGWNQRYCPDEETCKANCAVEGVTAEGYKSNYGIDTTSDGVTLKFQTAGGNVGSRLYVTDGNESYIPFQLLNREFTLDVDVATLGCGTNGAVYFVEMDLQGGLGKDGNNAGAKYGTGYCDAQCPNEKFVFDPSKGICCVEMDIWEANTRTTALTPHPCSTVGPVKCQGIDCGYGENGERWKGLCDKDGCDLNTYRMGATDFYGPGPSFAVDSTKKITVVTQFITSDGTDDGELVEIRRLYVQDGKLIQNANSTALHGEDNNNVMTDGFCDAQKSVFEDPNAFKDKQGLKSMGEALKRGMVLTLSVWDDFSTQMRWLDATWPPDRSPTAPGVARGPCDDSSGNPAIVRPASRDSYVSYTNIKYGELGSTYSATAARRLENAVHI